MSTDTPPLRLALVGDLMTGDAAISTGYGFGSRWHDGNSREMGARLRPFFDGADVVLGNLECVLSRRDVDPTDWQSAQMRGWPSYAAALRAAGITHLSLANNHATQHGADAFADTVSLLERAGIVPCGLAGTDGWCTQPVRAGTASHPLGILAYSLRPRQYHKSEVPPYAEGTPARILADVRRLRPEVSHLVVSLHWGEEYGVQPSADEVALARTLIDAGVSVVHGHHPHVLRPIERYGDGVIAYCLGNFASDMLWQREFRETVVLWCTLGAAAPPRLAPALIGDDGLPAPLPAASWSAVSGRVTGLDADAYARQTQASLMAQRRAAYRYALRNLPRFNQRVLRQILWTTLRRRVAGLTGRG